MKFPLASKALQNDVYIDDVVTGCNTLHEAKILRNQLIDLLKSGGFELRKWTSNLPDFLSDLPESHIEFQSLSFETKPHATIKILGLQWQPCSDNFVYKIETLENKCTKRTILSDIARIFDPLGFLTPVTFFRQTFYSTIVDSRT